MTDAPSKIKGLAWVIAAVVIAAAFALGISPLVRRIPWSWERYISHVVGLTKSNDACVGNSKTEALLQQLVNRLYPIDQDDARFSIDVHIVNDPMVNAYAQLGGTISLNAGLLENAESAEEIAGVLAHEIEHVRRRHILEGFVVRLMTVEGIKMILSSGAHASNARWTNYFVHMVFSRSQEAEADEGALRRLQKAHIDNQGLRNFFERMKDLGTGLSFLSDHPSNQARSKMVEQYQNTDTKSVMTAPDWKIFKTYCR